MREHRTDVNFDQYIIIETRYQDVLITEFKKPDTRCGSIIFINAKGVLAVTGDYGNWIFCREFHPSPDGFVSDSYWCEKLSIASTQKFSDYDPKATRLEIENRLRHDNIDEDELETDEREYLENLLEYVDECEERYIVYSYDHLPQGRDYEYIPIIKKLNPWLEVIFGAFDEICRRKQCELQQELG